MLHILNKCHIFVLAIKVICKVLNTMVQERKYEVGASGSGWGVWDSKTGNKVASFTSRAIGRFQALKCLYELNGWDWSRSKYVRENPHLAII